MGDNSYYAPSSADDGPLWQTSELLQGLISPAPAQSLVAPPPDTPPPTQPGRATPLTGNLAAAPTQAMPKTAPAPAEESAAVTNSYRDQLKTGPRRTIRHGLAAYFSNGIGDKENQPETDQGKAAAILVRRTLQLEPSQPATRTPSPVNQANSPAPDRSKDPRYVKVQSRGQIGYLPKSNLQRAKQRDNTLKVLD